MTTGSRETYHMHEAILAQPGPFGALGCLVPLQPYSYHLTRGTNQGGFRGDDPRFARADVSDRL